ncbi:MAG TPA: lipoate--protein ligase [Candidatus Limosilactobacillus merdigallinarum]|uniref:lipoate--protein ligase n=1 Tax=Candidatus Limosilactobacillus merdigallinarum TaxID=2838652 RepID=A0A9D1VJB4_9LACO|nr:lipoate--protein ligase [Candidatus Limosilactobacillus merdigallinarum]
MKYLAMQSHDIRRNLATEQYLMNSGQMTPPFMLFYIEDNCIIVGRNQNTLEEINADFCKEHGITITRRLSGGGAMFQDMGNLCFSFVVPADEVRFGNFKDLVQPVVDALHEMGATGAEVTGRNDIVIDGKKFSGNAMYTRNGKTFSHGTLMYDVNTDMVADALHVPEDKIKSKGIKSVRSRVTNLKPYLKPEYQNLTTEQFRDEIIKKIYHVNNIHDAQVNEYHLTDADNAAIDKIENDLYKNWDWVYGKSPEFTVKKRQHFDAGTIDARFLVQNGKVANLKIYGDFFGTGDVSDVEDSLKGITYTPEAIAKVLETLDLNKYFVGIPKDDVIALLAREQ